MSDLRKGKNVRKGVGVIPDSAEICQITNKMRGLCTTIGMDLQWLSTGMDVVEESAIAKNTNGGLTIKQDPMVRDTTTDHVLGEQQLMVVDTVIRTCGITIRGGRTQRNTVVNTSHLEHLVLGRVRGGGALVGVVTTTMTIETENFGM